MKKLWMLVGIVMLMAVVTTAQAEVRAGSFTVTPFIGGYHFEGNEDVQRLDSFTFGLRAGYNFTKHWGAEGYFNYLQTETTVRPITNNDDVNIGGYGIEGLYHFMPESRLVPFLAVGIGGIHYQNPTGIEDNDKLSVDYGGGVKIFLPDRVARLFMADDIALRADVRHILPLNKTYNDFLYTAGIAFSFGGKAKPEPLAKTEPVPEPVVEPEPVVVVAPPPPPVVVAKPKPVIIEKGRQTLDVKFDFDKSIIKGAYNDDINNLSGVMKDYPDLKVVIEGHTDSVGTDAYNKNLSQERADAVKNYMVEVNGIDSRRIATKGFGEKKPIADNATAAGRAQNRRVEAAVNYIIEK